jgi:transposase
MRHCAAFSHGSKSPSMQNQLFEAALGIGQPWYVRGVDFDSARKVLTLSIDFSAGTRFAAPGIEGVHRVHDTQTKRLRHLNFFQHECYLEVRTPRVKLPGGRVVVIEPDWFGKLSGFTLLFEALVLAMAQQMTFAAVAKLVSESWHRVHAICSRYVDLAVAKADLSKVVAVAIDETACRRGHDYLTIAADADAYSGDCDRPFQPKVITDSGDRDHAIARPTKSA